MRLGHAALRVRELQHAAVHVLVRGRPNLHHADFARLQQTVDHGVSARNEIVVLVVPRLDNPQPRNRRRGRVLHLNPRDDRRALAFGRRLHVVDLRVALDRRRELLAAENRRVGVFG